MAERDSCMRNGYFTPSGECRKESSTEEPLRLRDWSSHNADFSRDHPKLFRVTSRRRGEMKGWNAVLGEYVIVSLLPQ